MFEHEFYPTPQKLIDQMTSKIDFRTIKTVLEPSAGKGNIVESVFNKMRFAHSNYKATIKDFDIDTIEIDDNLQHILTGKGLRLIHDDFLTLTTYKKYDLIIMNPPFSNGEKHLLKAIELQSNGGQIVCILNAETLKNPYSVTRQALINKLEDLNANIEYIENAFSYAEVKTDVEIALIHINIERNSEQSIILDHLKQEEQIHSKRSYTDGNSLVFGDFIEGIIQQYNIEAKTGISLINEYNNLIPLMLKSFKGNEPILQLVTETNNYRYNSTNDSIENQYIKKLRMKYWESLFTSEKFTNLLTSDLRNTYLNKVNELKDYDFSYYNIKQIQLDINKVMIKSVEDEILKLFDEFSQKHSWYDETSKNVHYFNGWKTNKAWIINKKIIIPLSGYGSYYSSGRFNPTHYQTLDKLRDIEKVFNYLDGGLTDHKDIEKEMKFAEHYEQTKDIELKYFKLTFYKKGTCHITFTNEELLKKFNIFGSQRKGWLPPSYGKKKYNDMTTEEKQVINEFEGKENYNKTMSNTNYYLYSANNILMIEQSA